MTSKTEPQMTGTWSITDLFPNVSAYFQLKIQTEKAVYATLSSRTGCSVIVCQRVLFFFSFFFFFFFFLLFMATPVAYGSSQARLTFRAIAASLHHSPISEGSELPL